MGQEYVARGSMGEERGDDDNGGPIDGQFEYCAENYSLRRCESIMRSMPDNVNVVALDFGGFSPRTGGYCPEFIPQNGPNAVTEDYSAIGGTEIILPDGTTLNPEPPAFSSFNPEDVGSCYICALPADKCSDYSD